MVKSNNKNQSREISSEKEVFRTFANGALDYGNLPLPILLKIKKGILYIPSLYQITEGLGFAMKESLRYLDNLYDKKLYKVILQRNAMPDRTLSLIL